MRISVIFFIALCLGLDCACEKSVGNAGAGLSGAQNVFTAVDIRRQAAVWVESNQAELGRLQDLPTQSYVDRAISNASNKTFYVDGVAISGVQDHLKRYRHTLELRLAGYATLGSYLRAKKFDPKNPAYFDAMSQVIDGPLMRRLLNGTTASSKQKSSLLLDDAATDGTADPDASSAADPVTQVSRSDAAACDKINKAAIGFTVASLVPYVGSVANFGGQINDAAGIFKGCNGGPGLCDTAMMAPGACNKPVSKMSSIEYQAAMATVLHPLPPGPLSDRRLKDVIGDYSYGLQAVRQLHAVRFKYKRDNPLNLPSDPEHTGFVAQELRQIIPQAVIQRPDGFLQLDLLPVHWATVNAVKELADENDQLQSEVASLKGETAALTKLICSKFPAEQVCKAN